MGSDCMESVDMVFFGIVSGGILLPGREAPS